MLVCAVIVEDPRGGLSPDTYDAGWDSWNDMIRHSPAPWRLGEMTNGHLTLTGAGRQRVALARAI
jgi:hypothetical protein